MLEQGTRAPVQVSRAPVAVQRVPNPLKWFKKDKKGADAEAEAPDAAPGGRGDELNDAVEYERNLGHYLFGHPKSNEAAMKMIVKMITAVMGEFDEKNQEQQERFAKAFGRDDVKSAGQVGTEFDPVWAAVRSGNLRERMTAFMNVMFGDFKQTVIAVMEQQNWERAQAMGLNVDKMRRRKRQMKYTPGARDMFRDPRSPLDRKNIGTWDSSYAGHIRDDAGGFSSRTAAGLEQAGIGLSEREKRLQVGAREEGAGDPGDGADQTVQWQEGGTKWAMRTDNKWVKKVETKLRMPVKAGPSGTTLRMFQAWELLKKPVTAAEWRLAIMGWMLSSNDHSFHEMMMVAKDYGLPYGAGPKAYRDIAPLTETELRKNVAVGGGFPEEKAFRRKLESPGRGGLRLVPDTAMSKAARPSIKKRVSKDQQALLSALAAYTSEDPKSYRFMNVVLKGKNVDANILALVMADPAMRKDYLLGRLDLDDLIAEARELAGHAASGLKMIPPYKGAVYRGWATRSLGWAKAGTVVTERKFFSTSRKESVARGFADKPGSKHVMVTINSQTGRDIEPLSEFDATVKATSEQEVLFGPGSTFTIDAAPRKEGKYYRMTWTDRSPETSDEDHILANADGSRWAGPNAGYAADIEEEELPVPEGHLRVAGAMLTPEQLAGLKDGSLSLADCFKRGELVSLPNLKADLKALAAAMAIEEDELKARAEDAAWGKKAS